MTARTASKALIVESDPDLRRTLRDQLTVHEGYQVVEAETGQEALDLIEDQQLETILLDVSLPDIDGRDLCRLMRRRDVKAPIIMLSAHDSDADTILGLDSGASDYVTKPFRLGVLLARVRAHRRQFIVLDDADFAIGPYAFRPSRKILTDETTGRRIHLTERETAILKYLYGRIGRPVRRQALLWDVWGYDSDVTTHTLESHIYRLRQKIEPDPARVQILLTETDGYRLAR